MPAANIYPLKGAIQHYNWGGKSFLPQFLGVKNGEGKPFAEYWMGAHQNAPSQLILPDGSMQAMNTFISNHANEILGNDVNKEFGRLPFLFKILDVKDMLSIQVHPNKKAAEEEFAAENARGVAIDDPRRNYKDDNHKPELMYAWSDFWLLHGFKPADKLEKILNSVPELHFLLPGWKKGGYEAIYREVMQMDQQLVNKQLQPLIDRVLPLYDQNKLDKSQEDFWAARAYKTFCKPGFLDRGLFSIYFFNVVHLKKGEAIFQDAGILHAYLEGQNLELMANSDNVLRGGLTNKHIDVTELLKHVRFEPMEPAILKGIPLPDGEERFPTPAADFELRRIKLEAGQELALKSLTADIFLVMEGSIAVQSQDSSFSFQKADSFLAGAGAVVKIAAAGGGAEVFRATVPVN
jgi:mannose-6-phosphate isomerase